MLVGRDYVIWEASVTYCVVLAGTAIVALARPPSLFSIKDRGEDVVCVMGG